MLASLQTMLALEVRQAQMDVTSFLQPTSCVMRHLKSLLSKEKYRKILAKNGR